MSTACSDFSRKPASSSNRKSKQRTPKFEKQGPARSSTACSTRKTTINIRKPRARETKQKNNLKKGATIPPLFYFRHDLCVSGIWVCGVVSSLLSHTLATSTLACFSHHGPLTTFLFVVDVEHVGPKSAPMGAINVPPICHSKQKVRHSHFFNVHV